MPEHERWDVFQDALMNAVSSVDAWAIQQEFDAWVDGSVMSETDVDYLRDYEYVAQPVSKPVYELPYELGPTTIVTEEVFIRMPYGLDIELAGNQRPHAITMIYYKGKWLLTLMTQGTDEYHLRDLVRNWAPGVRINSRMDDPPAGYGERVWPRGPEGVVVPGVQPVVPQAKDSTWNKWTDWVPDLRISL